MTYQRKAGTGTASVSTEGGHCGQFQYLSVSDLEGRLLKEVRCLRRRKRAPPPKESPLYRPLNLIGYSREMNEPSIPM